MDLKEQTVGEGGSKSMAQGDDLEHQFPRSADHMRNTAAVLEHVCNILRDPRLDEFASLIGDPARKQPAVLLAGVVVLGFGLASFLNGSVGATGDGATGPLAINR
jgi:hypothetical protein